MRKKITLNANALKVIALCFMTIDHIGKYLYAMLPLPYLDIIFRTLGRIAAPLFLFVFVQSLRHSKSRLKMILRLYGAAVLMEIGNRVLGPNQIDGVFMEGFGVSGNIFMTFFFLSIAISGVEALWRLIKEKRFSDLGIVALCSGIILAAAILNAKDYADFFGLFFTNFKNLDYNFLIPLGCVMYFAGRKYECLVFCVYSLVYLIERIVLFYNSHDTIMWYFFIRDVQWFMLLALPFMLLYNGEEGQKHKAFYYLYYPIHQYILNSFGLYFILR